MRVVLTGQFRVLNRAIDHALQMPIRLSEHDGASLQRPIELFSIIYRPFASKFVQIHSHGVFLHVSGVFQ